MDEHELVWAWTTNSAQLKKISEIVSGTEFFKVYLSEGNEDLLCNDVLKTELPFSKENKLSQVILSWFSAIFFEIEKTHDATLAVLRNHPETQSFMKEHGFVDEKSCVVWMLCFASLYCLISPHSNPKLGYYVK